QRRGRPVERRARPNRHQPDHRRGAGDRARAVLDAVEAEGCVRMSCRQIVVLCSVLASLQLLVASSVHADEPPPDTVEVKEMYAIEEADPDREALLAWTAERQRRAKKGDTEIVQMPVSFRELGWGCPCPMTFIGLDTATHEGQPWLDLSFADTLEAPGEDFVDRIMVVQGFFTGERTVE